VLERDGSRPHRFSVVGLDGSSVTQPRMVDLEHEPIALNDLAGAPVIPNAADEAYAAVLLDDLSWQSAVDGLSELPDPLLRAVTWTNAATRVREGLAPVGDYLDVVRRHLGAETDPVVFDSVLRRLMRQVLPQWTAPEHLAAAEQVVAEVCAAALAAGDADRGLAAMRRFAATSTDVGRLQGWLSSGEARPGLQVDRDTRWVVVRRLVSLGEADASLVESEAAADRSSSGYQASLTALASRPDPAAKAEAWEQVLDHSVSNRDFEALVTGLWTPGQADLCAPYVQRYLDEGPSIAARGQAFAQEVAFAAPRFPMAIDRLQALRDDLEAAAERTDNTVLRRGWRDTVDDFDVALKVRMAG
jgi:aminopeptidase N